MRSSSQRATCFSDISQAPFAAANTRAGDPRLFPTPHSPMHYTPAGAERQQRPPGPSAQHHTVSPPPPHTHTSTGNDGHNTTGRSDKRGGGGYAQVCAGTCTGPEGGGGVDLIPRVPRGGGVAVGVGHHVDGAPVGHVLDQPVLRGPAHRQRGRHRRPRRRPRAAAAARTCEARGRHRRGGAGPAERRRVGPQVRGPRRPGAGPVRVPERLRVRRPGPAGPCAGDGLRGGLACGRGRCTGAGARGRARARGPCDGRPLGHCEGVWGRLGVSPGRAPRSPPPVRRPAARVTVCRGAAPQGGPLPRGM